VASLPPEACLLTPFALLVVCATFIHMNVTIKLPPEVHDILLSEIPAGLITHQALENAKLVRRYIDRSPLEYEVECDEDTAQVLLHFSEKYCPSAVTEIDFALRLARSKETQPPRRGWFR
jgi:hypothetical protein